MQTSIHVWAPSFVSSGDGITAFSRELALALSERATLHLLGKSDRDGGWPGVPLVGSGHIPDLLRSAHFASRAVISAISHRPDLIVSTHVNFGPIAHALKMLLGSPFVLVAHGIDVGPRISAPRLRALKAADSLWAVSRWTRARLLACGANEKKVSLVPNTVREEAFGVGAPDDGLRRRYSIRGDEKVILTVARLDSRERYKGCDKVLRAMPAVRQAVGPLRYLVVGTGDDVGRLASLAASLGLEFQVTFCGYVPDPELAAHYRLANVFAMPSAGEGFGIVFLEAMACGIPVLGGNVDGTTDALADGELGLLVDPESEDAVTAGLIDLLQRRGPPLWFDPRGLRARCLALYGRYAFRSRVRNALFGVCRGDC